MIRRTWTAMLIICFICGLFVFTSQAAAEGWLNEDGDWYYYNANGKKAAKGWQTIGDERYYFDEDGRMQTGWVEEKYYLGPDGAMSKGWVKALTYHDAANGVEDKEENQVWLYFQTSGRLHEPDVSNSSVAVTRSINGSTYAFGQYGAMQYGWVNVSDNAGSADIADYKYFGGKDDGVLKTNDWYYLIGPEEINRRTSDTGYNWYFFRTNGSPRATDKSSGFERSDLITINSQQYLFDEFGRARYGLMWFEDDLYYFGTADECSVQTGRFTIEDDAGNEAKYYFASGSASKGKGYTGVYNGELYYKGLLQTASEGEGHKAVTISTESSVKNYLVDTQGNIVKNALMTLNNGTKYKTNANGLITAVDGERIDSTADAVGSEAVEANVRK